MPASHAPLARTARRRVATGPVVGLVATALVALTPGTAWAAESRSSVSTYETTLRQGLSECGDTTGARESGAAMTRCIEDLAPPAGSSAALFDLFRIFSDCLYLAGLFHPDQMYPSTEETFANYVNECLGL
ncbi:MAG: hypothetical protein ACFCVF_13765 [Kineosporiaceae bacterium]